MFRAAPIAASRVVEEAGNERRASPGVHVAIAQRGGLAGTAMKWRTAERGFLVSRGVAAQPAGGRKARSAVAASRARRSRLPVRHAKSRTRWARSVRDDEKGIGQNVASMPTPTRDRRTIRRPFSALFKAAQQRDREAPTMAGHPTISSCKTRDWSELGRRQSECSVPLTTEQMLRRFCVGTAPRGR